MGDAKSILFGTDTETKQYDLVDQGQKDLMNAVNEGLLSGEGPLADLYGKFNQNEFQEGVANPAMKNFQDNILPMIQEKFIAGNQVLGSGMRRGQQKGAVDLQAHLAGLMYQAQQQQKQNQMQGMSTNVNKQTVENITHQGEGGLVQGAMEGMNQVAGQVAGAATKGAMAYATGGTSLLAG